MRMTPIDRGAVEGKNPYGKNKVWKDEGKTGKPFVSADDSMAYVSTTKSVAFDPKKVDEVQEADVPEIQETSQQYQKVDYKKRYDDIKRHYDKKQNEHKEEVAVLKEQLKSVAPKFTPPSTPEELEAFKNNNQDLYNLVVSLAHKQATGETEHLQEELKYLREELAKFKAKEAYDLLKAQVPDFEQIRGSDDFHDWAEAQPEEIQNWVYKNGTNVDLAVRAINLYKAERGMFNQPATTQPVQSAPQPRGDEYVPSRNASEEPSSNERVWKTSEIQRLSDRQYEQYRDEIKKAMREGRILKDTR